MQFSKTVVLNKNERDGYGQLANVSQHSVKCALISLTKEKKTENKVVVDRWVANIFVQAKTFAPYATLAEEKDTTFSFDFKKYVVKCIDIISNSAGAPKLYDITLAEIGDAA